MGLLLSLPLAACASEAAPGPDGFRHGLSAEEIHQLVLEANPGVDDETLDQIEAAAVDFFQGEFECPEQSQICARIGAEGAQQWYGELVELARLGLEQSEMETSLDLLESEITGQRAAEGLVPRTEFVPPYEYADGLQKLELTIRDAFNPFTSMSTTKAQGRRFRRWTTNSNWFVVSSTLEMTAAMRQLTNVCTRVLVDGRWVYGGYSVAQPPVSSTTRATATMVEAVVRLRTINQRPDEYWLTAADGSQYRFCGSGPSRGGSLGVVIRGVAKTFVKSEHFDDIMRD